MIGSLLNAVKRVFQPIRSTQYFTGIRQFNQGNYTESAEALFLIRQGIYKASILYRRLADFYYHRSLRNLALLHYYEGNYKECIVNCKRALEIEAEDKVCINYLAHTFHHVGQYSSAINYLRQLYTIEEDRLDVLVNLAKILVKADETGDAISILNGLINEYPNYADFYLIRGIAHAKLNHSGEAIANYKEAIRINPQFAKCLLLLGLEYIRDFQYEAAHEVFSHGADVCPHDQEMLFYSGLMANIIGILNESGFSKLDLENDSELDGIPQALMNDLTYLDDRVVSERLKNLDLDISYGEHFTFLDPIYDKPCLENLIGVFKDMIADYPTYEDYKYKIATFYAKLDKIETAKFYLQEALLQNPEYEDALVSLMQIHEFEGEFEQAEKVGAKILALHPDKPEYHLNQGRIMLKMKQYSEAVGSMTTARMLNPLYNSHLYLLGFILMEAAEYELARSSWQPLRKVYADIPKLLDKVDRLQRKEKH